MQRFEDQTVIVTGGGRETGVSHARGFAAEAANVVIAGVLDEECRWLARELGDRALFTPLDVTSEEQWDATVHVAEQAFGPVSVLVNNAGITGFGTITSLDPASWRRTIDVNLTGPYLGIRAVARSMRKAGAGSIVNICSTPGFTGAAGASAYSASELACAGSPRRPRSSSAATTFASTRSIPGSSPCRWPTRAQAAWRSRAPGWSPVPRRSLGSSCSSPREMRVSRPARSSSSTAACS